MNFFDAVYENSIVVVSTVVVISFSNIFVKIGRLAKSSSTGLFCVLLSTRACISLVVLLKNTTVMGLKRWRCGKKIFQTRPASRGFVGLQIKRDGGDLKIQSSSHLSAVKALKLKLNTLTWGIFGWFVYSVRYLVKVYKSLGIVLGTFRLQLLVTPTSVMAAPRVLFIGPGFWLRAGLFLQPRGVRYLINAIFLIYIGLDFFFYSSFFPHWNLYQWFFVCLSRFNIYGTFSFR